jgi:hypothetical protein
VLAAKTVTLALLGSLLVAEVIMGWIGDVVVGLIGWTLILN